VLQPGEEWALAPRSLEGNPNLWSPGIKYGVRPGSYTHLTEFFGPVLGVMRFTKLSEAVGLVNQTGYGLTSGLESLDEREWDYWKEHVHAGNLYLNRVTTGALVLRQPFGGFGKSVFGPGMKAGGPNYVVQFMDVADAAGSLSSGAISRPTLAHLSDQLRSREGLLGSEGSGLAARVLSAVLSYQENYRTEFGLLHDHFLLIGQDNFRRYLPVAAVRVRVHPEDTVFELFARVCAAHTVGSRLTVSIPPNFSPPALKVLEELTEPWAGAIEFLEESDERLAEALREHQADRVRYAAPGRVPQEVLQAAAEAGVCVVSKPVLQDGRAELLWYLQEQSLSIDYHRYGNLGNRGGEPRAEPQ
jgi:RHH-type proline utilization regulon transcriptional repressor/proline dehydrogenase/delta 1-pyrroline-5-carboxylate dehydrogenase